MRLLKFLLSILLLVFALSFIQAQEKEESFLEVIGITEFNNKSLIGAVVVVYKNNTKVKTLRSENDGQFSTMLEIGHEYIVEVSKAGMITKKIKFDTRIPEGTTGKWTTEFAMGMYKSCDGVDNSIYNDPVDVIRYDKKAKGFISDRGYVNKRMMAVQDFMVALDECHAKVLQDLIDKADALFREGKYEEARKYYDEALTIFPGDKYPKRRLSEINQKLNQDEENAAKYAEAVAEADRLLAEGDITGAKSNYMAALRYQPQENYAREKVAEIDKQIAEKQANDRAQQSLQLQYQNLMDKAAAAYAAKNYTGAKAMYQQAMELMPDESLPHQKVAELNPLIAQKQQTLQKQQAEQQAYQEAIGMADKAMLAQNYDAAKQHYQRAIAINPSNPYPRQKIKQIDDQVAQKQLAEQQALRAQQDANYNQIINQADMLYDQKKYEEAKTTYQQALQVKPSDPYAQQKLNTVNNLIISLAAQKQAEQERSFNLALSKGDAYKLDQEYALAIQSYQQALEIKPNEISVQNKINEANRLLAEQEQLLASQQERQNRYNQLITKADGLFASENYPEARTLYQQALSLSPNESYPRDRMAAIDSRLAEKDKQNEYQQVISEADQLFAQKSYDMSRAAYQRAMTIMPSETYPRQKINELNRLIVEQRQQESAKRQQYEQHIRLADHSFNSKDYLSAKSEYEKALELIPNEPYPNSQLTKLSGLIAQQTELEKEKKQQYDQLIIRADNMVAQKQYDQAKSSYLQALSLLPQESYPREKINELDRLIAEQRQQESLKRQQYDQHIRLADNYFNSNNFSEAGTEYQKALALLPNEAYPNSQLTKINGLLAQQAQQEARNKQQYEEFINRADNLLTKKEYDQAKSFYQQALTLIPQEQYPRQKIAEIDRLQSEQAQLIAVEQQKRKQYDEIIQMADNHFSSNRFVEARSTYVQAQTIFPTETYPASQISKIDILIAEQQRQARENEEQNRQYQQLISQADQSFGNGDFGQAKSYYQQALRLKPNELYPANRLAESDRRLAAKQAQQQYDEMIRTADSYLAQQSYSDARSAYIRAGNINPEDAYPKTKIAEIDRIVAENNRQEAEQQRKQQEYQQTIGLADRYFNEKNYTLAQTEYQKARTIKPDEQYPDSQLSKIQDLLAQQRQAEQERQKLEQQYAQYVSRADAAFRDKNYTESKGLYTQAQNLKPGEIHPRSQIDKINEILAQQETENQRLLALENQYNETITSADQAFSANSLKTAREFYLKAIELKPGESYPRSQIRKIEERERYLAQQEARRQSAVVAQTTGTDKSRLTDLNFKTTSEKDKYFADLRNKYPAGVTLETHKEKNSTTKRYIIIRGNEVSEFRFVKFSWGGTEYSLNGKPITATYFNTQVRVRQGEAFQEFNF